MKIKYWVNYKNMSWEQIKLTILGLFPAYVGSGKLIDDQEDGNTPSALSLLVNLVHNQISGYPVNFNCLMEKGTINLDGSLTYNLKTLFPDLKTVKQLYGLNQNQSQTFFGNKEANITPVDGWTVIGNNLVFTGYDTNGPTGTAKLLYKSNYLVKDENGNRQRFFLTDSDYSVLDEDDINVIIFGIGQFINWNSDSESQDRKKEVNSWYIDARNNMVLNNKNSDQVDRLL